MRLRRTFVAALVAAGCGGGSTTADPNALTDGTHLTVPLEIPAGMTISIAPGARLTADPGVTITVRGTLKVASASGRHAVVAPAQAGMPWGGVTVESGGTLDAEGLDLEGTAKALQLKTGTAAARYDQGTITGAEVAFDIARGARLDTAHATVVGATQASGVDGQLHARYLDYDKAGLSGGIILGDPTAVLDVTDSRFHAPPAFGGGDYLISLGASLVHVAYTTITGSHCAFHFDSVDRFEIDHVTAGAEAPSAERGQNSWGAMLYGSGAGPHVISNSNFMNREANLDYQGPNGPMTITNTFSTGLNTAPDGAWTWAAADVAAAPIPDAQPR